MLNMTKCGPASQEYFSRLVQKEYYLNGGEPPGWWHGKGAEHLGLFGTVETPDYDQLWLGFAPDLGG